MREYGSEHHWQSRQGFEGVTRRREIYAWRFYRSGRDALKQVGRKSRKCNTGGKDLRRRKPIEAFSGTAIDEMLNALNISI